MKSMRENFVMFLFCVITLFLMSMTFASATLYVGTTQGIFSSPSDSGFSMIYNSSLQTGLPFLNVSNITKITTSQDGMKDFAIAYYNDTTSYFLRSTDGINFGAYPFHVIGLDNASVYKIPIRINSMSESASGQYIFLTGYSAVNGVANYSWTHSFTFLSNDFGASFFVQDVGIVSGALLNAEMDATGQYIIYGLGANSLSVTHSSNFGNTFTTTIMESTPANFNSCQVAGVSSDGKYQYLACSYTTGTEKNFIFSQDYGASWNYTQGLIGGAGQIFPDPSPNALVMNGIYAYNLYNGILNGTIINSTTATATKTVFADFSRKFLVGTPTMNQIYTAVGTQLERYDNQLYTALTSTFTFPTTITALSYTQSAITPITPVCLDANTYCSNPQYTIYPSGVQLRCYVNDTQNCAQGCSNATGVAICSNNCQNYCNIIGTSNCASSTSQYICQDSLHTGCLDLNTIQNCAVGTYCVNSAYTSFCTNVSQSGTHAIYGLAVTPYAVNDENTVYNVDALNKIVSVKTANALHTQLFYTTGTTYYTRNCKYNETLIYSQPYANVTNDTLFTMTSADGSTQILKINFLPSAFGGGIISIRSQAGSLLSNLQYVRNVTAKSLCINYVNGTSLYCNYDYALTDTLANVQLNYMFDMVSKTYTIRMTFNNSAPNVQATFPIAFTGTDVYTVEFNVTAENTDMFGFNDYAIPQPNGFTQTITANQTELYQACQYTALGTFVVRTYGNENGAPDYTTYTDYTVNILGLGVNQQAVEQQAQFNQFGNGISDNMKLVIVLVGMIIIIGFGIVIGFQTDTIKMSMIVSIVFAMFGLIIATLYAWVPVWVFVSLAIIGLAVIIFASTFRGNSNTG